MMTSGGFNPQDAISQWQNSYDGGTKVRPPIPNVFRQQMPAPVPQMGGGGGGFQQIPFNWFNSMKPPQPAPQQSSWGTMPGSANNYGHGFTPGGEIYKGMASGMGSLLGAPPRPPMMGSMMNSIFGSMQPQRPQPMPAQPPAPGMPLPPSGRSTLTGYYG